MDISSLLKTIAPWIGTAIGGPLGGMAIEAAANALGISEKTTDAVKAAISGATPEQMLALKKADQDFALQMQALGFKQTADLEALAVADTKSARDMQVANKSRTPDIITAVLMTGFFVVLFGMMFGKITESPTLSLMIGALIGAVGTAVHFWLGSTGESARKTGFMAQAQEAVQVQNGELSKIVAQSTSSKQS